MGRDVLLEALDDQALRVRIREKEPKNLDDTINLASRLETFDIMGSTGTEAEKGKSRFVCAAAGGKESPGSGETKISEEILKQLAYLKGLVCSYRRDLDKQQQGIEGLKRSYQPPVQGNWNLPSEPRTAVAAWPGTSSSSRSPLRFRVSQSDRVVGQLWMEEFTERVMVLNLETLVGIVKERDTGFANVEEPKGTEARRRNLEL